MKQINMNLDEIDEYVDDALTYLKYPNMELNKDEIIMYLSCISEIILETKIMIRRKLYDAKRRGN